LLRDGVFGGGEREEEREKRQRGGWQESPNPDGHETSCRACAT
jgi:hypothetical protein